MSSARFELAGGAVTVHVEARAAERARRRSSPSSTWRSVSSCSSPRSRSSFRAAVPTSSRRPTGRPSRRQMPAPGRKRCSSTGRRERCDRWPLDARRAAACWRSPSCPRDARLSATRHADRALELVLGRRLAAALLALARGPPLRRPLARPGGDPGDRAGVGTALAGARGGDRARPGPLARGGRVGFLPTRRTGPALRVGARAPPDRPRAARGSRACVPRARGRGRRGSR